MHPAICMRLACGFGLAIGKRHTVTNWVSCVFACVTDVCMHCMCFYCTDIYYVLYESEVIVHGTETTNTAICHVVIRHHHADCYARPEKFCFWKLHQIIAQVKKYAIHTNTRN